MSSGVRSVVIHGHFYQPPREDPWIDRVPRQPTAAPFHDWNARIERECYRAVTAARLTSPDGRIRRIVNALSWMSFNFGPTLLQWLEREAPDTHRAIVEADRESAGRHGGHGNAMAMAYHHPILPLATRRDKVTEVRWGIADFHRRFGRRPEGMWLPETAVDEETLDVLASEGIRFTVLAPHQVDPVPAEGLPGRYTTRSGKSIALFVYDGGLSHDVAFGQLLGDAAVWAERMAARDPLGKSARLVSMATDGETFGHHHRFGDMALAAAIDHLREREDVAVESYASFLARHEPREEVDIVAPTAWSCAHGVERWRSDCGCKTAPDVPSQQKWRTPLREALEWLAGSLHEIYEDEGGDLFEDPWAVRDHYGTVVGTRGHALEAFVDTHARRRLVDDEVVRGRELLEMERNSLRLFSSCGWFFDDVAGLEQIQVLSYAARAIDLAGPAGSDLEEGLLERLEAAESNDPEEGNGRDLYLRRVKPGLPRPLAVAAGVGAVRALLPDRPLEGVGAYRVCPGDAGVEGDAGKAGTQKGGRPVVLKDELTGRKWSYRVEATPLRGGAVEISVREDPDGTPRRLLPADLPEGPRERLAEALRHALVERLLGAEDRSRIADGASLPDLAGDRLVAAVRALGAGTDEEAVALVLDLTDLVELAGGSVPFDAQTAFWTVCRAAGSHLAPGLGAVGERLGFAMEELAG